MDTEPVVTVVGLGKLGCAVAAVFSAAGFVVHGCDQSADVLGAILANKTNPEPGLNALIGEHPFNVSDDTSGCARESDVALIVVPTPSGDDGRFDSSLVCAAVRDVAVGFAERARATYPVIVVISTVMPGESDGPIREAIESSGLTVGADCGYAYMPSLIALGSVIENLRHPDLVFVGAGDDVAASRTVTHLYRKVVTPGVPFHHLSAVDAEIAKLSINVFLGVKIGYANTVARVCEQFPGADAARVLGTVGSDGRIGSRFLQHGGTPGGPCLGRDQMAFETVGGTATGSMVRQSDGELLDWVAGQVERGVLAAGDGFRFEVAVLGVAYKPQVPVWTDSFGLRVVNRLRPLFELAVHDPCVSLPVMQRVMPVHVLSGALDAAVVVVACAHPEYAGIMPRKGQRVIDVWGLLEPSERVIRPGIGYQV